MKRYVLYGKVINGVACVGIDWQGKRYWFPIRELCVE